MKSPNKLSQAGFTLIEVMMAAGCGTMILAALLAASVSLQKGYTAVEAYSIASGDQLRVQDYIAMDCRRATNVTWDSTTSTLTLTLPSYYDGSGNPVAPSFDANGKVQYTAGSTTNVSYYQSGSNFMRQVGNSATVCTSGATWINCSKAIATDVATFAASITDSSAASGTIQCSVTFSPRFQSVTPGVSGTTVFAQTFLRNAQARQ